MKNNKSEFNIYDYKFNIIRMDVYSQIKCNIKTNCEIVYYLLVDENNWIHDFKILFKNILITNQTTKSHQKYENDKKSAKGIALNYRFRLLNEYLDFKHQYVDDNKKNKRKNYRFFTNNELIQKINLWLFNQSLRNITFQEIEYIITGSNPKGQGKTNKGTLNIKYNNNLTCFGFFFQCLNVAKEIKNLYVENTINYQKIWDEKITNIFNDYQTNINCSKFLNFKDWLTNNNLLDHYFMRFNKDHSQWKQIMEDFKNETTDLKQNLIKVEKDINKARKDQKDDLKKLEQIINQQINDLNDLYKFVFNNDDVPSKLEFAHIKPVYLIKKECLNNKNYNRDKLIKEISDVCNLLPLESSMHKIYDNQLIYWNENGILKQIKEINQNDIKRYLKINNKWLIKIKQYLNDYNQKIILKENNY